MLLYKKNINFRRNEKNGFKFGEVNMLISTKKVLFLFFFNKTIQILKKHGNYIQKMYLDDRIEHEYKWFINYFCLTLQRKIFLRFIKIVKLFIICCYIILVKYKPKHIQ